jgi:AmiR/NasT family two-component response regulator
MGEVLDQATLASELAVEVEHLRKALLSRDVIGQAKGILMERFKVTADEAFHLLVESSQHRNVRVADLAVELADTGEWLGPTPG